MDRAGIVTPCHILPYASSRKDKCNILPACFPCHHKFEPLKKKHKKKYLRVGQMYWDMYVGEVQYPAWLKGKFPTKKPR